MERLADVGHVEARFGPFVDSANLNARRVQRLRRTYQRLGNHLRRTGMNS
jgi:hypothetical protein